MTTFDRLGQDPAASAYGDMRRAGDPDAYMREAERVRTIMAACGLPPVTPDPVLTPAEETADGEREVRAAMMQGFRL